MDFHDRASQWFAGLDPLDQAAVSALGGCPLPRWVADSPHDADIPTVSAEIPIGTSYRSADFMITMLSDLLAHTMPTSKLTTQHLRLVPALPAA